MEKEIQIGERTFKIKELTLEEGLDFKTYEDNKQTTFEFVSKCLVEPKLTADELRKMPFKDGIKLVTAVNELNGLSQDFTKPKVPSVIN